MNNLFEFKFIKLKALKNTLTKKILLVFFWPGKTVFSRPVFQKRKFEILHKQKNTSIAFFCGGKYWASFFS